MSNIDFLMKQLEKKMEAGELETQEWKLNLIKDNNGKILNCIDNYILYFTSSSKYKGKLKYNEFLQRKEFKGEEFTDFDEARACNDIEHELGLSNITKTRNAIIQVFDNHRFNPVQDYLKSLKWDGQKRIEKIFIDLLEADDTELNRSMSKKWFMAAVKRVMIPGCKFDNILIFQGAQGIGKTTICEKISRGFSNTVLLSEITNKDVIDKLNKTWIGIVDEMDAFSKKDMTTVKTFLSTSADAVRLAYGRNTQTFKRHSVFIGSTNDDTFLRDSTSSVERRFWIIKSNREKYNPIVNEILTDEYIDQLWAEAYYELYKDINQYLDIDNTLAGEFAAAQKEFKTFTDDINIDYIKDILDRPYMLVNGEFNDNNDFLKQYTEDNMYTGIKTYINKIPMSSLIYVLKNVYKVEKNAKYIKLALSSEWEYKNIWYKGKSYKGLYRKIKNDTVIEDKNEILPI